VVTKKSQAEHEREYRVLAQKVRQAAVTASTQEERADLLGRAKLWDFLADHPPAASSHFNE
jgi:hypothetical protein